MEVVDVEFMTDEVPAGGEGGGGGGNEHNSTTSTDAIGEWTIQAILKQRKRRIKYVNHVLCEDEYYIKWEGYPDEYNSWHTLEELHDLIDHIDPVEVIADFLKGYGTEAKKKKKAREKEKNKNKADPAKWTDAKKNQAETARTIIDKIRKEALMQRKEYLKMTKVLDPEERFKKELAEAKAIQESLEKQIKEELDADVDEEDDDDWDWEEYKPKLEEEMEYKPPPKAASSENKRMEHLRVVKRNIKKRHYSCKEDSNNLREAIVCILGHVDAGKTTLLDTLRQTSVQKAEAGGITQQIGATHIPLSYINMQIEELSRKFPAELKLPGFLFIDTPGHESFSNMRVRGSSLCDIAIVVVDVLHGLQSQAKESLRLLKRCGARFVVALNKIDRLHGWKPFPKRSFRHALEEQSEEAKDHYKKQLNMVRQSLMEQGIIATTYWNCKDLDLQVPIIPICGLDGCGIPDLLMYTMLYAQCVLTKQLTKTNVLECAVFEVHEAQGLGQTIDVLLINGTLRVGQKIVLCGMNGPIITTIRGIFLAKDMQELKGHSETESHVEVAEPVRGVKLWARDLDYVVGGSYLYVLDSKDDEQKLTRLVMSQLEELYTRINISSKGIHVQASTLGSLEALLEFLNENGVSVGSYGLGEVHLKDVKRVVSRGGISKALIAFDVVIGKAAQHFANINGVDIISGNVIYQLLDRFKLRLRGWLASNQSNEVPCIVEIDPSFIIHGFTPLIIGVDVLLGSLNIGTRLYLIDSTFVGAVESIQTPSSKVAMNSVSSGLVIIKLSAPGGQSRNVVFGRDFFEDDKFFTKINRRSWENLRANYRKKEVSDYTQKLLSKYGAFLGYAEEEGEQPTPESNNTNNNRRV